MKCPKCDGEMVGKIVDERSCYNCGLREDSQEYMDAVNVLFAEVAEEDVDASLGW